jgi:predicted DNA-binding transcriptional regulator YafY
MRASRLLSLQLLLETRGRMSARALSEALGVSVRTLHRDVDQLGAAGVPIYAERGRDGGFQLLEGWNSRLTGLTPSEAQAVFLSGLAGPASELGLGSHLQGAQLKLLAALPASWRDEAQKVHQRFHFDPVDWYREADPVPHLAAVAEAVWGDKRLAVRYESWRHDADRELDPLGLVLKSGAWYLVAALAGEPRTFRISNIKQARVLDARAKRPRRFDLERYWAQSVARFESELNRGFADVLATAQGLRTLTQQGAAFARAVAEADAAIGKDGRRKLRVPIESIEHATALMVRLAPEVEVAGPAALRKAVARRLQEACTRYGIRAYA